jgi:hypothetical protein
MTSPSFEFFSTIFKLILILVRWYALTINKLFLYKLIGSICAHTKCNIISIAELLYISEVCVILS